MSAWRAAWSGALNLTYDYVPCGAYFAQAKGQGLLLVSMMRGGL